MICCHVAASHEIRRDSTQCWMKRLRRPLQATSLQCQDCERYLINNLQLVNMLSFGSSNSCCIFPPQVVAKCGLETYQTFTRPTHRMVSSSISAVSCCVCAGHLQTLGMIRSWPLISATVGCRWEQLQVKHICLKKEFTSEVGIEELDWKVHVMKFRNFLFSDPM